MEGLVFGFSLVFSDHSFCVRRVLHLWAASFSSSPHSRLEKVEEKNIIFIHYIFSNLLTKLFTIFGKTLPNFEFVSGFCFRFRGLGDQPGGDLFDDEINHHVIAEKSKVWQKFDENLLKTMQITPISTMFSKLRQTFHQFCQFWIYIFESRMASRACLRLVRICQ